MAQGQDSGWGGGPRSNSTQSSWSQEQTESISHPRDMWNSPICQVELALLIPYQFLHMLVLGLEPGQ